MSLNWEAVVAHALSLPDAILTTYYGGPAVKANDRPILSQSDDPASFCLHMDRDKIEMLKQIDPDTFWQTPHYEGWPAVLLAARHLLLVRPVIRVLGGAFPAKLAFLGS